MIDDQDMDNGYSLCRCGGGVFLLQSGDKVDLHMCAVCRCEVADQEDFEHNNAG